MRSHRFLHSFRSRLPEETPERSISTVQSTGTCPEAIRPRMEKLCHDQSVHTLADYERNLHRLGFDFPDLRISFLHFLRINRLNPQWL